MLVAQSNGNEGMNSHNGNVNLNHGFAKEILQFSTRSENKL